MNLARPMPTIGVDMLYWAKITKDDELGVEYTLPIRLEGVNEIGYEPRTQSATYDADDGTYASFSADGATTVSVKLAGLLPQHLALLLGLSQSAEGVVEESSGDRPPEGALGWRAQCSDGAYRFVWVLKGKFSKNAESYVTKSGQNVTFSDKELTFTALNRVFDGKKRRQLSSSEAKLPVGVDLTVLSDPDTGWFSDPDYLPVAP